MIENLNHFQQCAYSLNQVLQEYETEALSLFQHFKLVINIKKLKQSRYRPGVAQRFPRS